DLMSILGREEELQPQSHGPTNTTYYKYMLQMSDWVNKWPVALRFDFAAADVQLYDQEGQYCSYYTAPEPKEGLWVPNQMWKRA
ncbi:hypothetical protein XENOCAPTIV_011222, partial [Xenoophorus captivus]